MATHLHGYNTSDMSFHQIHMFSQQMGHLPMEMLLYAHYLAPMKGMSQPNFQLFWQHLGAPPLSPLLCFGNSKIPYKEWQTP